MMRFVASVFPAPDSPDTRIHAGFPCPPESLTDRNASSATDAKLKGFSGVGFVGPEGVIDTRMFDRPHVNSDASYRVCKYAISVSSVSTGNEHAS